MSRLRSSTMRTQSARGPVVSLKLFFFSNTHTHGEVIPLYHFPYDYAHVATDVMANLTRLRSYDDDARPFLISFNIIWSCMHLKVCALLTG